MTCGYKSFGLCIVFYDAALFEIHQYVNLCPGDIFAANAT